MSNAMPKFATSDEDATERLHAYAEQIGLDPGWGDADQWKTTIRIAQDKKHGLQDAFNTLSTDLMEIRSAERVKQRSAAVKAGLDVLKQATVTQGTQRRLHQARATASHYGRRD